jgi:hypothetical protein
MAVNITCFISEAQWERLPEDTPESAIQRDYGTFEYVQVTYECIRGYRENEDEVAFYLQDGEWYPEKREPIASAEPPSLTMSGPWFACGPDTGTPGGVGWTDIVISEVKP